MMFNFTQASSGLVIDFVLGCVYLYECVPKNVTRNLIYQKFVVMDFFWKIKSTTADESYSDSMQPFLCCSSALSAI